jgi:choline dehydrogenase
MADFIIVGAGAAGCVLAARLSEDPGTKVLLLEAGGQDAKREVKIPIAFSKLFRTDADWAFSTETEPHADNRQMFWPRGKMLGGSTSLNAMMYVRGHRADYDQWRQLGNSGWGYDDVLPYFKRSEGFSGSGAASGFHGTDGAQTISDQRSPNPITQAFIAAGESLGLARLGDLNGPTQDGIGLAHVYQKRGQRWSAADAFLKPALQRPNLQVMTGALVEAVTFEGTRATGVRYRTGGQTITTTATREVILSAGSVGSPHILMLSGVGAAAHLKQHGLGVVADLPGVGQNLQDHLASGATYYAKQPVSLAGAQSLGNLARYLIGRRGPLTSNVAEGVAFIRTREGLAAPDVELILAPAFFVAHGAGNPDGHGFTVAAVLLRPESRGAISLKTADPAAAPRIQANYLSTQHDGATLLAGVKFARKIAAASAFDHYRGDEHMPGKDIVSDADLLAAIRQRGETLYHPVGTAKMGTDPAAVVDAALRVRGVQGLRVADASIMPTLIGGHTQAPATMIGEKAADLVRGINA